MKTIGIIHTEFTLLENMPIQPRGSQSVGRIIIDDAYTAGLKDLDGFSHIYLIYCFHRSEGYTLSVRPFLDEKEHGVFATRAPRRPNPIGLSIVRLLSVVNNVVEVADADVLDGTPLLDIKPYIGQFDQVEQSSSGWMQASDREIKEKKSDTRFL